MEKHTVLLVDDDVGFLTATSLVLEHAGYLSLIHISEPTRPY